VSDINLHDDIRRRIGPQVDLFFASNAGGMLDVKAGIGLRPLGELFLLEGGGAETIQIAAQLISAVSARRKIKSSYFSRFAEGVMISSLPRS